MTLETLRRAALAALAIGPALLAMPAQAVTYSYTGTLPNNDPDAIALFTFDVLAGEQDVTIETFGYAGGVNGEGTVIASGGFDPILTLFDATGTFLAEDDDSSFAVDGLTGLALDSLLVATLDPGTYYVAISTYLNFADGLLPFGEFLGGGSYIDIDGNKRSTAYAFDVVLTPLPAALPLLGAAVLGLGMLTWRHRS